MTELRLGLRLALAGGRTRALLVAAGTGVGVVVLLLATSIPGALPRELSTDDRRLAAGLVLFLVLPVVALLASTARLSAAVRDRRLAALRLLGVTAVRTRMIAASEAAALAVTGAAAGALGYAAVVRPAVQAVDDSWRTWFHGRPLAPPAGGWVVALVGVPLLSVVVALVPVQAAARSALAARRQGPARRPSWWRLLPLAAGTTLLVWTVTRAVPVDRNPPGSLVQGFFTGAALTAVALPLIVPVAVRLAADIAARRAARPATLIAARRLQQEPAGTTRLVAALLVALFTLAAGRCVLAAFETTPQYRRAALAATTGPQRADLFVPAGRTVDPGRLAAVPGVRAVVPVRQLGTCDPADTDAPEAVYRPQSTGARTVECLDVFVGSCAQLAAFSAPPTGCRDDRAGWLDPGYATGRAHPTSITVFSQPSYAADGTVVPGPGGRLRLNGLGTISVCPPPSDPNWTPQQAVFVPASTPGLTEVLGAPQTWSVVLGAPQTWSVVLGGGDAPLQALRAAAGPAVRVYGDDRTDLATVQGYRAILYAVAAVVLSVGLAALLINGVDRAMERRRHLAALTVLGVPSRVVRRSQLLQAAAPLLLGLPLAGAAGLLTGAAYLNLVGVRSSTPWPAVSALTLGALTAGLLVAAATVAGLGGTVRAHDLRQE